MLTDAPVTGVKSELALTLEQLDDNHNRRPGDGDRRKGEQTNEGEFESHEHAFILRQVKIENHENGGLMAHVLVLRARDGEVLEALALLSHRVTTIPAEPAALVNAPASDVIIVDARSDLASAKSLCKILVTTGISAPLLLVVTESGFAAITSDWGVADVVLDTAHPAEVDARIRLAIGRVAAEEMAPGRITAAGLVIDEASYSVRVNERPLDLTYKEFELLRFLATHPSRVFTREQLLSEVWGYDYFGGTRTVDVHVRRLRAKLGDMEQLIGTVRNVGYRFNATDDPATSRLIESS